MTVCVDPHPDAVEYAARCDMAFQGIVPCKNDAVIVVTYTFGLTTHQRRYCLTCAGVEIVKLLPRVSALSTGVIG